MDIVSVQRIEDEIAKQGLWQRPDNPNSVDKVVPEYGNRFYSGNRR